MAHYYKVDPWRIIEEGFNPRRQRASESIFSIGNGCMGQRANFEEYYSGDSLQGSYIGGIYYPDKTKVGWWKNGYPKYFAKVINAVNWIGIDIAVNGKTLDLALCDVHKFQWILDMKRGILKRLFIAELVNGNKIEVTAKRFLSMTQTEVGAVSYSIKALNFDGTINIKSYLDGNVKNEDANYGEQFWLAVKQQATSAGGYLENKTKKLNFHVAAGMQCLCKKNGVELNHPSNATVSSQYVSRSYKFSVKQYDEINLQKLVVVASSLNHERKHLQPHILKKLTSVKSQGFKSLEKEQAAYWHEKWETCDISIEGDEAAQQGIRFNIFQLYQTYTGADIRLNIGPKGFTGEKYGGVTYWDTEGYCLPFYLSTAGQKVAKNLLLYRYRQLPKAIENAEKLGFNQGAALYPMVTINGEECHNEWEITFEEIHRNGAIAYAIFNYICSTDDTRYLLEGGVEVLIGIARFWRQRFQFSEYRQQYVMLGVTGPNEYENNVNNNWYTSYIARWSMKYAMQSISKIEKEENSCCQNIRKKVNLQSDEIEQWQHIVDNVYFPEDKGRGVFLQQDGFLDKNLRPAESINADERPINQHWSWDRILRSCFIKQGDVIQGMYFFEHHFDEQTIRRNYDFYEPMTVHESSLSPCVHAILASKLGYIDRAYELYLRTARLDLDDYNEEVAKGLHITSMAGTWMTIVEGFAGKRIKDGLLSFTPSLPDDWDGYSFKLLFRERLLKIDIQKDFIKITCEQGNTLNLYVYDKQYQVGRSNPLVLNGINDRNHFKSL